MGTTRPMSSMASMPNLHLATIDGRRDQAVGVNRFERVVGQLTLAAIAVAVVLVVVETAIPGDEVDAVWLASAAAIILLARHLGFWPSIVVTVWAAAAIVLLVVRPNRGLAGATAEDFAALTLFVVVAVLGSRAVSSGRRPSPTPVAVGTSAELVEPLTEREGQIL